MSPEETPGTNVARGPQITIQKANPQPTFKIAIQLGGLFLRF